MGVLWERGGWDTEFPSSRMRRGTWRWIHSSSRVPHVLGVC